MKFTLPIILVVVTAGLMVLALVGAGNAHGTVGIAAGSAVRGLTPKASTPEQGSPTCWWICNAVIGTGHSQR